MFSMRSARAPTSGANLASSAVSASTRALPLGDPRLRLQPVELVVGVGQLVGDDEAGHEQEADFADPAHGLHQFLRSAIDVGGELGDMLFLASSQETG